MRQLIGYRYEAEALGALNALYREYRLYTNFLQPVLKLKEKVRVDGKVKKASPLRALARRVYDEAQAPYQRTLASPHVRQEDKDRLQGPVKVALDAHSNTDLSPLHYVQGRL